MQMLRWLVLWIMGVVLLFSTPLVAVADSPAPQKDYTVYTENGAYRFVMLARLDDPFSVHNQLGFFQTDERIRNRYPKSGLYSNDGSDDLLWTVDWYAFGVEVSSDGEHLVRRGPWPFSPNYQELALAFYKKGQLIYRYAVVDLVAEPSFLPHSVSHYRWAEKSHFDDYLNQFSVTTYNGEQYVFDIETGAILEGPILSERGNMSTEVLGIFTLIAFTVVGLIFVGSWHVISRSRRND